MKYRQLTKEQFYELHKEFANFLATQSIDVKEWNEIKSKNPELAEEELNLFSDIVWEDVLNKTNYLEHFSKNSINLFKFNDDKIHRIVLKGDETIDFLKNNSVNWLINNYKKESIEIFKGEKFYNKDRNKEIFFLIEKGAEISNGKLFNFFKSKI